MSHNINLLRVYKTAEQLHQSEWSKLYCLYTSNDWVQTKLNAIYVLSVLTTIIQ